MPADTDIPRLPTEGLDILLTNDDGWEAAGIRAVHAALREAGHRVTMVAPATNQSGVSARIDFHGAMTATQPLVDDPSVWAVSTSPSGAVLFGVEAVLGRRPDLVVSGANIGFNTGFDTNFSGTIGAAAVAAGMLDIPALAVSTDALFGAEEGAAYAETAEVVVDLLAHGLPRLPRGQFLNMNYPLLTAERTAPLGHRYAPLAAPSAAAFAYRQDADDPTSWRIQPARSTEEPAPGSDAALLRDGWITWSILGTDRSQTCPSALTSMPWKTSGPSISST